jgi:hypothetical protein
MKSTGGYDLAAITTLEGLMARISRLHKEIEEEEAFQVRYYQKGVPR